MIFKLRNFHRFFFTYICPTFYGGAPSTPSNTTSNVTQNTIPKELMPYASGMLQAAKKQLYTTDAAGKITGYQPYKPFSTNANDYVAGFTPLQQQAQQGIANLQMPGQFGQATNLAQQAGNYSQLAQDPNAVGNYMSPYMQNVVNRQKMEANRDFDISGAQQMGQATRAGAFGGSREAIMAAENERNRQWKLSDIQASGTQNAFQNAQQNMQFGNQAQLASAQALGQLGEAQQNTNLNMLNAQNTFGGQQQQQQQQAINQAVLNYQNEINQPYLAAGTMSDLIRGTPMNNMTTMNYQAQPSFFQQAGGAAGTAASLYMASQHGKMKNGGIVQSYAEGGITDESAVSSYLDNLTSEQLRQLRQKSQSVENTKIIDEILARKEGAVQTAANGGILRFNGEHGGYVGENYWTSRPYEMDYSKSSEPTEEYTRRRIKEAAQSKRDAAKTEYKNKLAKQNYETRGIGRPMSAEAAKLAEAERLASKVKPIQEVIPEVTPQEITSTAKNLGAATKAARLGALGLMTYSPEAGANSDFKGTEERPPAWEGFKNAPQLPSSGNPKAEAAEVAKGIAPLPTDKQSYTVPGGPLETAQRGIMAAQPSAPSATSNQPTSGGINTGADQQLTDAISEAQTNAGINAPVVSNADEKGLSKEDYDKSVTEEKRLNNMSTEDIMRERNAEMERLGIKSPDQLNAEERKQIGEERANAQDEQKRQIYLRMAEFFSNWGSTPGAPLAAGLKAMKETLPGVMDDSKAHHKLMSDLNKSERDLNRAVELEKAGRFDKASALKEAASKRLQDHEESWMVLSMRKQMADRENATALKQTEMQTDTSMAGHLLSAANDTKGRKDTYLSYARSEEEAAKTAERAISNIQSRLKGNEGFDPKSRADLMDQLHQLEADRDASRQRANDYRKMGLDEKTGGTYTSTEKGSSGSNTAAFVEKWKNDPRNPANKQG